MRNILQYQTMIEAMQWAMEGAEAVPEVRWTTLLLKARITYWTDVDGKERIRTTNGGILRGK